MSVQIENLEKNMVKLTITVAAEEFDKAITASYNKNKGRFNVPGFRKGHATQAMIEKAYGVGAFYEDAVDICIDASYPGAVKESELEVVSRPEMDIKEVEKGKDLVYTALVAVRPEVTLGDYKGIEVTKANMEVTSEDIDKALKTEQERNARLISVDDRAVESGDMTTIDFDGSIDGVAFAGGKSEDYQLEIGSHSFIEGFEDKIIGHNVGEEFAVEVTFPTQYQASELAGKAAKFQVKVKEIKKKEMPELNDEFAGEVSEFETLDAYKEDLKKKLSEEKAKHAATENENNVIKKVIENAKMDIPDPMVEVQLNQMVKDYAKRMEGQGIALDQYMKITGMTMEQLKDQMKPAALQRIQTRLVLEEIVKAEDIQTSDEAVDAELEKMAEQYKMEIEKMKEYFGEAERKQMKDDLAVQEAVDMLVAEAKLV